MFKPFDKRRASITTNKTFLGYDSFSECHEDGKLSSSIIIIFHIYPFTEDKVTSKLLKFIVKRAINNNEMATNKCK